MALEGHHDSSPSHSSPGDGIWEISAPDRDCDCIQDDDILNQQFGIQEVEAEKMACVGDKCSDCVERRTESIAFGEVERKEDEKAVDATSPSSAEIEAIKKCALGSPNLLIGESSKQEDHRSLTILLEEEGHELGSDNSSIIHQLVQVEEHIDPQTEKQQSLMLEQPKQWNLDNMKNMMKISLISIGIIVQNFKKLVGTILLGLAVGVNPVVEIWKAFRGHKSSIEKMQDKMVNEMEDYKEKLQSLAEQVNQGLEAIKMLHRCITRFENNVVTAVETLLRSHTQLCAEFNSLRQQISDLEEAEASHRTHFADSKDPTD